MKKSTIICLSATLLLSVSPLFAADQAATVTEVHNQVNYGPAQSTASNPAKTGTKIHDGEYVKTGAASRAELELANKTVTRIGANTIFNYSATSNQIDLQAGTMLFSKPKDGQQLNIKTAAVTAAIVGTTGFGKAPGIFGIVEGKAKVVVDGKTYVLHAGQLLVAPPGGHPQVVDFDIGLFLKTSTLVTGFKSTLPNEKYIADALADYNDDVDRGFIQKPKPPYFTFNDNNKGVPTIPINAIDSAGTSLGVQNTPPYVAPQTDNCCYYNYYNNNSLSFNTAVVTPSHHHHPHAQ